jgi:cellobiose epimerase
MMTGDSHHQLHELSIALENQLRNHILPYWSDRVKDREMGGFYGRIDGNNHLESDAPRGSILNSRILWTFAAAFNHYGESGYLTNAKHEFEYIEKHFWDHEQGGVYWMLSGDGNVIDSKKHVYAQAFAIYAYSEYFKATASPLSLKRAIDTFEFIDQYAHISSQRAYHEAFSRDWKPLSDVRLSDIDAPVLRSTNTHLHILEAYANLYRVWPNELLAQRLSELIDVFLDIIFDPVHDHFFSFFDDNWTPQSTMYSYGHDIEAAWLIVDASQALGSYQRHQQVLQLLHQVAQKTISEGINEHGNGLYNQGALGKVVDTDRHWWSQAEAIVGLVYAWKDQAQPEYIQSAKQLWDYTDSVIIDHKHGEWFFRVNDKGEPYFHEDKVGPWKCPYHTSRACLILADIALKQVPNPNTSQTIQV